MTKVTSVLDNFNKNIKGGGAYEPFRAINKRQGGIATY